MKDSDLRWQLRQLPREIEPQRDLWPGIAARLEAPAVRRRTPWRAGLAIAASVLVALVAWRFAPPPADAARRADEATERIVQAEANAITREYQAALSQYEAVSVPAELVPSLATLDRSVADIRSALARDTDSVLLLEQLQRTYSRRLEITQRLAAS
jgi:hypothetical protein